jgi:hypothetical protein
LDYVACPAQRFIAEPMNDMQSIGELFQTNRWKNAC